MWAWRGHSSLPIFRSPLVFPCFGASGTPRWCPLSLSGSFLLGVGVGEEEGGLFLGFVSPMFEVLENIDKDIMKFLIDNGAKVDYETEKGVTALFVAVHSSDYDRIPRKPIPLHPAQLPGVKRTGRGCELPYRFAGSVWRRRKFVLRLADCSPCLWLTKYYAERTVSGG